MTVFVLNILLALAWAAMTGSFTFLNILFGYLLGYFSLWLVREQFGTIGHFKRVQKILSLVLLFLKELMMSAVRVSILVLRPDLYQAISPGIIAYPLKADRDFEITLLANLITLTPGTLSVDVSEDRKFLYVHAIAVPDKEALCREIEEGFERKIMEAFR